MLRRMTSLAGEGGVGELLEGDAFRRFHVGAEAPCSEAT